MNPKQITSQENPKFKAALKLLSNRGRQQRDQIVIFGVRETLRAIDAGANIAEIYTCADILKPEVFASAETRLATLGRPIWDLPLNLFTRLAYGDRVDGMLAVAARPNSDLSRIALNKSPLVIVLESVEKPGNIGAVARSADAIGATALILASPISDLFHPNSIRASLGCIFSLQTAVAESETVKLWLLQNKLSIVAAEPDANALYTTVDLKKPTAIVLGNEARGLSKIWTDDEVQCVRLPMRGLADSLNVSVTAAVMMFEAARQRIG